MNVLQLTPGAGAMYCGNCLRDNALVAALRRLGHQVTMVPLYLPLTLDEADQSVGAPIFFGGISVYLAQQSRLLRHAPDWFHGLLASPPLLKWAAGRVAQTRPAELGDLTLSILQGEAGNQARELHKLIAWLKNQPRPDVICLSNAMLLGLARRLSQDLAAPIVCALQGEDFFLDALPEPQRAACWETLRRRAADVALFVAPSRYFAELMRERLGLGADRVRVVHNGINLEGYGDELKPKAEIPNPKEGRNPKSEAEEAESRIQNPEIRSQESEAGSQGAGGNWPHSASKALSQISNWKLAIGNASPRPSSPVPRHPSLTLGFFARMCQEKGLDTLVDAFILLRQGGRVPSLKLRIGGNCGPADVPLVKSLRARLLNAGLLGEAEFCPNLDRPGKLVFLRSLSVFSVPARYGEAFGLYVLEALAAGVPVVLPHSAAFPELIEATRGGVLCAPNDPPALAAAIEQLVLDPARAQALGEAGRRAVFEKFGAGTMAQAMGRVFEECRR